MDIDLQDDEYIPSNRNDRNNRRKKTEDQDKLFEKALKKYKELSTRPKNNINTTKGYNELASMLSDYAENNPSDIIAIKLLIQTLINNDYIKETREYYTRILEISHNDIDAINAKAYFDLKDGNTEDAISDILDALYIPEEDEKTTKKLKENLELLRKINESSIIPTTIKPESFLFVNIPKDILKDSPMDITKRIISTAAFKFAFIGVVVITAVYLLYIFYPYIENWIQEYRYFRIMGNQMQHVSIKDIDKLMEERIQYNIKLSEEQIKQKFALIKDYIAENKYNHAMILINELENSNASDFVKERIIILRSFLIEPNMEDIDYVPSARDVLGKPFLYEGIYVRWMGTVANLEHFKRQETAFELLINFVDEATVEGIAELHYDGFVKVSNGDKINVYGKLAGLTLDNKIVVKGIQLQNLTK